MFKLCTPVTIRLTNVAVSFLLCLTSTVASQWRFAVVGDTHVVSADSGTAVIKSLVPSMIEDSVRRYSFVGILSKRDSERQLQSLEAN